MLYLSRLPAKGGAVYNRISPLAELDVSNGSALGSLPPGC